MAERATLGEAVLRDGVRGVLARTRAEDRHRAGSTTLRTARNVGRRPGKGAAALCRKVIEAIDTGRTTITIWATAVRRAASCSRRLVLGIDRIMHATILVATPINLGSSELVSINDLLSKSRPSAASGWSGDTTRTRPKAWPAAIPTHLHQARARLGAGYAAGQGLAATYAWIEEAVSARKAGQRIGVG